MKPLFAKTADGTVDLGINYNPLTGGQAPKVSGPPALAAEMSFVETSVARTVCQTDALREACRGAQAASTWSHREWETSRHKHVRTALDNNQKYKYPVASSQAIGWSAPVARSRPAHGKPKCFETKAVESQILGARNIEMTTDGVTKMHF